MTDYSTSLAEPEAPEYSTQLDAPRPSDETVKTQEPAEEPKAPPAKESRLDTIKRAAEEVAPKKEEPTAKEAEAKPADNQVKDNAPEGDKKPEAELTPEQIAHRELSRQREEERRAAAAIKAPHHFMPRSKELWGNVPNEVKAEIKRMQTERDAEIETYKESAREYEPLREYADMARKGGTDLKTALDRYVGMENMLRENPTQGLRGLIENMGLRPDQAIGHVMAAYGIRPEQLIQNITGNPAAYSVQPGQAQPQQPQTVKEVAELRQQMERMQSDMQASSIERDIIAPFAAENPRYYELQDAIAQFLQSDMVPKSLDLPDRLAAAYDLAVRISPRINATPTPDPALNSDKPEAGRAGTDFGGNKSVRGAPASGVETTSKARGKLSRTDALKAAMAELGIAS